MRITLLAALLGSTALAAAALAQTPAPATPAPEAQAQATPAQPEGTTAVVPAGQAQAKAAIAECDRLISFLDPNRPTAGITVERAQEWKRNSDADACKSALDRLTQASTGSAPGETQAAAGAPAQGQTGPTTAPVPQVVVQQQQPTVTVRQARPEIIVRIPPPVITVQQPQPEIIVRMPEPDVNVAVARPEVQVTIPPPQVQVQAPGQQSQANVQVERQEPNVRIERTGEPQIVYRQAEGQPQIRFEPVGGNAQAAPPAGAPATDAQRAQAQLNNPQTGYGTHAPSGEAAVRAVPDANPGPQTTGALPSDLQALTASRLEDMDLYNAREEKLGDVEAVVTGAGGRTFLIVSHGGFLGLGEKRVVVPAEQVGLRGDRLIVDRLSDEDIRNLPAYDRNAGYRELQESQSAQIRTLR